MNIKINLLLLLCSIIMSSCGVSFLDNQKKDGGRIHNSTASTFNSYISNFEANGKTHLGDPNFKTGDIPVNFGDTGNEQYKGICINYSDGTKEIIINEAWWNRQSDSYRESLLFHELGHCVLARVHHNQDIVISSVKYKVSMMNEYILAPNQYAPYKKEYLKELFTSSTGDLLTSLQLAL